MEEVKIRELSEKSSINTTDHLVIEDADGTKKVSVKHFRSLVLSTLYFNSVKELKESSNIALKEGDICETLGYHYPGDGGGATYIIDYDPAAVADDKLIHNLAYSDTLRAKIVLNDTVNVHQFGAYGDGINDDTVAIQAAINQSKIVEFGNNKKYCVNETIIIKNSNAIINGNGATLYPLYVEGIKITSSGTSITNDVSINKLHFDCSRAVSGINVYRASKIDINGCNFKTVTDTGINLSNCSFVTIDNCHLIGNNDNTNHLIAVNGQAFENALPSLSCKFIDIEDTKFSDFYKAIDIVSTGSNNEYPVINLHNCRYDTNVNNASCIYTSCPVELLTINSSTVTSANTFLFVGGASGGPITCKDMSCLNTNKIFDIASSTAVLRLDGSINTSQNAVIFERMTGKLYSNVMWESLNSGASFNNKPTGEINDVMNPYNYNDTKGYTITGSRLTLHEARNMHVNWTSSTNNLTEIVNGVKGQLMYLRSSTNKSITSVANKILLSESAIKLGTYYGVMLKFDGLKWVQISNLTTVSALNNSIANTQASGPIVVGGAIKDSDTTYTLFKDGNEIILADSNGERTSVIDENTTYELTDFDIIATADEINKLAGSTLTKDELNILDGAVVSTDELNKLLGIKDNVQTQIDGKAPTDHADASTMYGIGTSKEYGHVKLSDTYIDEAGAAAEGIGASQLALHDSYARIQSEIGDINTNLSEIEVKNEDLQNQIYTITETGIPKLNVYQYSYTATENQTVFKINLNTFSKNTDTVFVQSGITLLAQGNDFTVTDTGITLVQGVPAGRTVTIYVFKNVPNGKEGSVNGTVIYENSLPLDRLERMPTHSEVGAAPTSHTHKKSEITDFPTEMKPSAHSHTKSEITDFPTAMTPTAHTHKKSEITDFPTTMTPSAHTHKKSEITDFPTAMTPTAHNQAASTITAGTLAGKVLANASAVSDLGAKQVRNIYAGTSEISTLAPGDIYILYE